MTSVNFANDSAISAIDIATVSIAFWNASANSCAARPKSESGTNSTVPQTKSMPSAPATSANGTTGPCPPHSGHPSSETPTAGSGQSHLWHAPSTTPPITCCRSARYPTPAPPRTSHICTTPDSATSNVAHPGGVSPMARGRSAGSATAYQPHRQSTSGAACRVRGGDTVDPA